jgi:type II secretory pathway pseudopilin PulG
MVMVKAEQIKQIKQIKRKINNKGFTLIELAVGAILAILIAGITGSLFLQTVQAHRRQQRVMQVERALLNTHQSLKQSLTTLPGRNLGVVTQGFSIPLLPSISNIYNPETRKNEDIRLGLVTPAIINENPAFMVIYSDGELPRLPIGETTTVSGDIGSARVPTLFASQYVPPSGGSKLESNNSDKTAVGTTKPTPSPSPSPSPSSSPSPSPEPTKFPSGGTGTGTTETAIPPNVPIDQTLSGLPYYASPNLYNVGDLMLLVGASAQARLVKLTNISQLGSSYSIGSLSQNYINFTYDLCMNGDCDSERLPGVSNVQGTATQFRTGSILVPIRIASFYVKQDKLSNRLIRNDGGVILPSGDGSFRVVGGTETILGEVDNININYVLDDDSVQQTPSNLPVSWLNQIKAVDITLIKGTPGVQGDEKLNRSLNLNFPLIIRHLQSN